jgi:hypothetical protein
MSSIVKRLRHAWEQVGMIDGFEDGLLDLSCVLEIAKLRLEEASFSPKPQSRGHALGHVGHIDRPSALQVNA